RSAAIRCSAADLPPRALRRDDVGLYARPQLLDLRRLRLVDTALPHACTTRFQYEPYARRVPADTPTATTGTYSAKVGVGGRVGHTPNRSAGEMPIRSNISRQLGLAHYCLAHAASPCNATACTSAKGSCSTAREEHQNAGPR